MEKQTERNQKKLMQAKAPQLQGISFSWPSSSDCLTRRHGLRMIKQVISKFHAL
jgi:hypothetical protein